MKRQARFEWETGLSERIAFRSGEAKGNHDRPAIAGNGSRGSSMFRFG